MNHPPSPAPALWQQLQAAAAVVQAVTLGGHSLNDALAVLPAADRPGVQALAYHALRHWGQAQALQAKLVRRAPPAEVAALLGLALALACPAGDAPPPYSDFTLVDQTVEAAKRQRSTRGHAAFINGCLRSLLRQRQELLQAVQTQLPARFNHPLWWIRRLQKDHPRHWQALLQAARQSPPMTLRVNLRRQSRASYLQRLAQAGLPAQALGQPHEAGVLLARPVPVTQLPGFEQGCVSVQDAAAQRAAPLLLGAAASQTGQRLRVLDACAAPGGKTAHLLELRPDAQVLALDVDARRAARIQDNLTRLALHAQVQVADAARPDDWWDDQPFDAILLDAPCSASGISRRHPDARWLRRESDIAQLARMQTRLLEALWPLLAVGGRLLYATCSVFDAEGQAQITRFLQRRPQARPHAAPGYLLPDVGERGEDRPLAFPDPAAEDGFFYALLEKIAP
ncbi:MAG: 16S rRNA (cytosine(967)-C(5))-methyltransferase RsmB [Ottowia sp.]